jgi:hypothetical protein
MAGKPGMGRSATPITNLYTLQLISRLQTCPRSAVFRGTRVVLDRYGRPGVGSVVWDDERQYVKAWRHPDGPACLIFSPKE